ncbi:MAG: hypothetical protein ACT4OD_06055 [Candidatus Nitrosotenuis sp.]
MKWIPPKKLKVLTILFFATGAWGVIAGLFLIKTEQHLFITLFGVINICIGGFLGYRFLTQGPKPEWSPKKSKK